MKGRLFFLSQMENVLVAGSNVYALRAIAKGFRMRKIKEALVLAGAMSASMLYHALEVSKHDMPGVIVLPWLEKHALNADRAFAALAMVTFLRKRNVTKRILFLGIGALTLMALSECQHVVSLQHLPKMFVKTLYLTTHVGWHISAFHIAYLLL